MVSKYTTGIPMIQTITGIDPNMVLGQMTKKQESFDLGFLTVQEKINKKAEIDLLRKQDIDYYNNKLKETTDSINNSGNIDYSDGKVVGALSTDVDRVSQDSTVKKAILSTVNYRQWQTRIAKLKENPKMSQYYNAANEAWDMRQVDDYVMGKTDRLDLNSPTLFVDVNKELGATLSKLKGEAWNEKEGKYILNGVRVTEKQVEEAAKAALMGDGKYGQQIKINAWAKYKDVPDDQMVNNYRGVVQKNVEELSLAQEMYEAEMNAAALGSTDEDKARYTKAKQARDSQLQQLEYWKSENNVLSSPDVLSRYSGDDIKLKYETENTVGALGKLYSWSKGQVKANPLSIMERKFEQQKIIEDLRLKNRKDLEQYKSTFGTKAAGKKSDGTGTGFENAPLAPMMESQPIKADGTSTNYFQEYSDRIKSYQATNFSVLKNTLSKIFDGKGMYKAAEIIQSVGSAKEFDTAYEKVKKEGEYSAKDEQTKAEIFNLYNGILKTYDDARDGNIENYDVRVLQPDIRENMNLIAQNANSAKRLEKEISVAESRALQEVYGGNKNKMLQDLAKQKALDTSRTAYDEYLSKNTASAGVGSYAQPLPYDKWKKTKQSESSPDTLKKYQEQLSKNVTGSAIGYQNYLMSEGQLGKDTFTTISDLVTTQAYSTGVRKYGEPDVYAFQGKAVDQAAKNSSQDMDKFKDASAIVPVKYDAVTGQMQVRVEYPKDSKMPSEIGYVTLNPSQQQELLNRNVIPKKDFMTSISEEAQFNKQYSINGGATERYWTTNADIPYEWQVKKVEGGYISTLWLNKNDSITIVADGNTPFTTGEAAAKQVGMYVNAYVTDPNVQKLPNTQEKKKAIFDIIRKDSRIPKYGY